MSLRLDLQSRRIGEVVPDSGQFRIFPAAWLPVEDHLSTDRIGFTAPVDPACWEALCRFAPSPLQRFEVLSAALQVLLIRYCGIFHTDALRYRFTDFLSAAASAPVALKNLAIRSGMQVMIAGAKTFEEAPDQPSHLTFVYLEDGTQCGWRYLEAHWAPGRIALLNAHFWKLLEQLLADPLAAIGSHDYRNDAEVSVIAQEWAGQADFSQSLLPVPEAFEETVRRCPDEPAVIKGRARISYEELNQSANQLAHYLMYFSVRPASVVALRLEPGPDLIYAMLAVLKLGAVVHVLDPQLSIEQAEVELAELGHPLLITRADQAVAARRAGRPILDLDREKQAIRSQSKLNPGTQVLLEHAAAIVRSGQSERAGKHLLLLHRNLAHAASPSANNPFSPKRQQALTAPASSAQGMLEIWSTILNGSTLHIPPPQTLGSLPALGSWLRRQGIASWILPAAKLSANFKEIEQYLWEIPQLVITEGPLYGHAREKILRSRPAGTTWELAGPAGCLFLGTVRKLRPSELSDSVFYLGRPAEGSAAHLLDAAGLPVPVGIPGELCIEGPQLAWGFLDDAESNQTRFLTRNVSAEQGGRLFRSGRLAYWDAQGRLVDLGPKESVARHEESIIHLHTVESLLRQHSAVVESAVVIREVAGGLKRVIAYVALQEPVINVRRVLREFLLGRVPDALLPNDVIVLDHLPLTPAGTLDRAELEKPVLGPSISGAEADARAAELALDGAGLEAEGKHFTRAKNWTSSIRNLLRRLV
jgi:non-ribosomal peptide synthetase component F